MKSVQFRLVASALLATLWLPSFSFAQQSSDRREQPQKQEDSDQGRQESRDDDETEYRGMEHAALGVMLGEQSGRGVRIRDLLSDSPAERAGLRAGDRILKIDDKQMQSYRDVIRFVNRVKPGQEATITVNRDGDEKTLEVRFASHEDTYGKDSDEEWQQSQRSARQSGQRRSYQLNSSLEDQYRQDDRGRGARRRQSQDEDAPQHDQYGQNYERSSRGYDRGQNLQRRQQQGMDSRQNNYGYGREDNRSNERGWSQSEQYGSDSRRLRDRNHGLLGIDFDEEQEAVVVRDVWAGSPAERAGIRRGDEILSINGEDIEGQDDLVKELRDYQPGERLRLVIYRNGEERTVRARLASQQELSNQGSFTQNRSRSPSDQWRSDDGEYDGTTNRPRLRQAQRENRILNRNEDR